MQKLEKKQEKKDLEEIALAARREKAEKMLYEGKISRVVPEIETYVVESQTRKDTKYFVKCININYYTCTCPDFERQIEINKNHKCKHIVLVEMAEEFSFVKKTLGEDQYDF